MKIVLFYAAQTNKNLEIIQRFEKKVIQKGHSISCVEATKFIGLEYTPDRIEQDTIYGFCLFGLTDNSQKDILFLAKMLKNEYTNKPSFIYSDNKIEFRKIKRQLLNILKDKNFDVVLSKVKEGDAIEIDKAIEKLHLVYRTYYEDKKMKRRMRKTDISCDICEMCTEKNEV